MIEIKIVFKSGADITFKASKRIDGAQSNVLIYEDEENTTYTIKTDEIAAAIEKTI